MIISPIADEQSILDCSHAPGYASRRKSQIAETDPRVIAVANALRQDHRRRTGRSMPICHSIIYATVALRTMEAIDAASRDNRITELLEANNREVERRREAEHALRRIYLAAMRTRRNSMLFGRLAGDLNCIARIAYPWRSEQTK